MKKLIAILLLLPFLSFATSNNGYTIKPYNGKIYGYPSTGTSLQIITGTEIGAVVNTAITNFGGLNGSIYITAYNYTQTVQINLTGNGSRPTTQLIIYGDGEGTTQLSINVTGLNNFKITNNASVVLRDIGIFAGNLASSCILADTTGAGNETSMQKSRFDNLYLSNASTTIPALWLKDFFTTYSSGMFVVSNSNTAVLLENHSNHGVLYGNSEFDMLSTSASATFPNAGLVIRSTDSGSTMLDHITFTQYYCYSGYYGIAGGDAIDIHFITCDIESPVHSPVCLGLTNSLVKTYNLTQSFHFTGGTLLSPAGDTTFISGAKVFGTNLLGVSFYPGDNTTLIISDQTPSGHMPNYYDINLIYPGDKTKVSFVTPANIWYSCRQWDGTYIAQFNY